MRREKGEEKDQLNTIRTTFSFNTRKMWTKRKACFARKPNQGMNPVDYDFNL